MNRHYLLFSALLLLAGLCIPGHLFAGHTSGHVTLHCDNEQLLHDFNEKLKLGPRLCQIAARKDFVTVQDEVTAKITAIIEQAKFVLNMYPRNIHVNVVILPTSQDCSTMFAKKYGIHEKKIAYYSLSENTIYISVTDARVGVVAHELAHAVVDFYFSEQPPYPVHELMAQAVEKHIESNKELIQTFRRMDENAARIRYACSNYPLRDE